jgi:hypothetical protein
MKLLGAEKGRAKIEGDLWGLCRYKGLGPGRCPRGTVLEGGWGPRSRLASFAVEPFWGH